MVSGTAGGKKLKKAGIFYLIKQCEQYDSECITHAVSVALAVSRTKEYKRIH